MIYESDLGPRYRAKSYLNAVFLSNIFFFKAQWIWFFKKIWIIGLSSVELKTDLFYRIWPVFLLNHFSVINFYKVPQFEEFYEKKNVCLYLLYNYLKYSFERMSRILLWRLFIALENRLFFIFTVGCLAQTTYFVKS